MHSEREFLDVHSPGLYPMVQSYRRERARRLRQWAQDAIDTVVFGHHDPDRCRCPFHDHPRVVIALAAVEIMSRIMAESAEDGHDPSGLVARLSNEETSNLIRHHPAAEQVLGEASAWTASTSVA